jgi:hypothetical protein
VSIAIGTVGLSILVVGALGLICYIAVRGRALDISNARWPFVKHRTMTTRDRLASEAAMAATRDRTLARLEEAFRQIDAGLTRLREERAAEQPVTAGPAVDSGHVEFLQDLAEAGMADDGELLVKLTRRRLPPVMQRLQLRLEASGENAAWFVTDEVADAERKGTVTTIRPAVLRGEHCLSRGYARRYV